MSSTEEGLREVLGKLDRKSLKETLDVYLPKDRQNLYLKEDTESKAKLHNLPVKEYVEQQLELCNMIEKIVKELLYKK